MQSIRLPKIKDGVVLVWDWPASGAEPGWLAAAPDGAVPALMMMVAELGRSLRRRLPSCHPPRELSLAMPSVAAVEVCPSEAGREGCRCQTGTVNLPEMTRPGLTSNSGGNLAHCNSQPQQLLDALDRACEKRGKFGVVGANPRSAMARSISVRTVSVRPVRAFACSRCQRARRSRIDASTRVRVLPRIVEVIDVAAVGRVLIRFHRARDASLNATWCAHRATGSAAS